MLNRHSTTLERRIQTWAVIAVVAASSAYGAQGANAQSAMEGVAAGNKSLSAALASGDGAAAGALYTEAAFLLPPNAELMKGWENISEFWKKAVEDGLRNLSLETLEVIEGGETATEVGRYKIMDDAGEVTDRGKYLAVWRLTDGRWLLHRDIWNTSLPAQ